MHRSMRGYREGQVKRSQKRSDDERTLPWRQDTDKKTEGMRITGGLRYVGCRRIERHKCKRPCSSRKRKPVGGRDPLVGMASRKLCLKK
eukprot:539157-Pyramimonas_sp.AAC.1